MEWLIVGIIAAIVSTVTAATKETIERRKVNRSEIELAFLNGPVYNEGMDYKTAKIYYIELYRRDPAMFNKVYNEVRSKRYSEGLDNKQDVETESKEVAKYAMIVLFIVLVILVIKDI
jgi:hypothetical protein